MTHIDEVSDREIDRLYREATVRLEEHAGCLLHAADAGCGQCLFCYSCGVRLAALDVVAYLAKLGAVGHLRYRVQRPPVLVAY
jgi:hypothetical protein